jgi:hypothetical protein
MSRNAAHAVGSCQVAGQGHAAPGQPAQLPAGHQGTREVELTSHIVFELSCSKSRWLSGRPVACCHADGTSGCTTRTPLRGCVELALQRHLVAYV